MSEIEQKGLKAQSDTPRTDESIAINHFNAWSFTAAEHARQLERELADVTAALAIANRSADYQMFQKREATKQRDDARECLREAVRHADSFPEAYPIEQVERWRKAAGMEDVK